MTAYRVDLGSRGLTLLLLCAFTIPILFLRLFGLWWIIALLLWGAYVQFTNRIEVADAGISTSIGLFPLLPRLHRFLKWSDVTEVRPLLNIAFVEADALVIEGYSAVKKKQRLLIPVASLGHRQQFLNDLTTRLPKHTQLSLDVSRWASAVALTPRWQLGLAMAIIFVLAAILWFQH